ncbi:DsbA family oxidoreductase [Desulfitobacterium chlororespirans]|uniref:Predicted dithiol-disulfide isomerase, DsbA family n=1 Tax=Desulfitobacterium chlororespirans DSM 11544 TaxID=1121395 RepID=A0A1M7SZM2_9FIRM|nr:DsbA family protein [Desulfitobacterium chlororespirans]SHN63908.1 Predicted dithiol-disulfide isomerase, DsbA family [Desulfitobacterium chlororespirans DSM 11544]
MMQLEVFFDYTCPYCYLAFHELKQILPEYPELTIQWRPCEINPQTEPRMSDWDEASLWLIELRPRLKQADLSIHRPFEPGNYTSLAIQGLLFLDGQGADIIRYNEAVYSAVFRDGKDIENIDVLSDCAALAGGDVDAFRQALVSGTYREKQLALNQYAWQENALDSVPSFRLGDARLNAVYGAGVLRQQLTEFFEKHIAR